MTPQLIKDSIALIPTMDTEVLSHTYKCFLTTSTAAELKQLDSFMQAILKELRSRTKVYKEPVLDTTPDMYEPTTTKD